ncbi:MAG: hypothetical protein GX141_06615 [Armatimonadetes bacterium]|nr:hypothetical protein [Armatimonadota bacterium]
MKQIWTVVAVAALVYGVMVPVQALAPNEILVVYNANEDTPLEQPDFNVASRITAQYYAEQRSIPPENVVGLLQTPYTEAITDVWYRARIASPLWANYLSKLEYSHIKCIVLCYGIPSRIIYQPNYDMSVDSALTLLGNPGVPNAQGEFARQPGD